MSDAEEGPDVHGIDSAGNLLPKREPEDRAQRSFEEMGKHGGCGDGQDWNQ